MRAILVGLIALVCAETSLARGPVHVRGYTTKSGKYVAPHYRSAPDHSRYNNWSTVGNVNPYTGKSGTKYPYGGGNSTYSYIPSGSYPPSYSYPAYSPPSYTPQSDGYSPQVYRVSPRRTGFRTHPRTSVDTYRPAQEAVELPSGVVMMPAKTKSGYCLQAPEDYIGTGSLNYPIVSDAMPRCGDV